MILSQNIILKWFKDCRGGSGAVQRSRLPQSAKLPADFFDYIPFGRPLHRVIITQNTEGFHIQTDQRVIVKSDHNKSLRLSPMELITGGDNCCEVRYRYDWHEGAMPARYRYKREGSRIPLNESAFVLYPSDYGRAVCNGRFVDWESNWWYEMSITNVLVWTENIAPLDCFLINTPTHYYHQIAMLR